MKTETVWSNADVPVPEPTPRAFDLLRRLDLLATVQQRNLAHLHQVNADRVVDVVFGAGQLAVELIFFFQLVERGGSLLVVEQLVLFDRGILVRVRLIIGERCFGTTAGFEIHIVGQRAAAVLLRSDGLARGL